MAVALLLVVVRVQGSWAGRVLLLTATPVDSAHGQHHQQQQQQQAPAEAHSVLPQATPALQKRHAV
jgi:hypothetical protein